MARKKVNRKKFIDATLTTLVKLTFDDENEGRVTDDFKLVYYALSPRKQLEIDQWAEAYDEKQKERAARKALAKTARDKQATGESLSDDEQAALTADDASDAQAEDEAEVYVLAELLAQMIHQLPEIVEGEGEDEKPMAITVEELAGFAPQNLLAMRDAIRRDVNPNAQP
jgi:hypothetical protein